MHTHENIQRPGGAGGRCKPRHQGQSSYSGRGKPSEGLTREEGRPGGRRHALCREDPKAGGEERGRVAVVLQRRGRHAAEPRETFPRERARGRCQDGPTTRPGGPAAAWWPPPARHRSLRDLRWCAARASSPRRRGRASLRSPSVREAHPRRTCTGTARSSPCGAGRQAGWHAPPGSFAPRASCPLFRRRTTVGRSGDGDGALPFMRHREWRDHAGNPQGTPTSRGSLRRGTRPRQGRILGRGKLDTLPREAEARSLGPRSIDFRSWRRPCPRGRHATGRPTQRRDRDEIQPVIVHSRNKEEGTAATGQRVTPVLDSDPDTKRRRLAKRNSGGHQGDEAGRARDTPGVTLGNWIGVLGLFWVQTLLPRFRVGIL